jgi:hypothetical protein
MMAENQNVEREETSIARLQQPKQPALPSNGSVNTFSSATEAEATVE